LNQKERWYYLSRRMFFNKLQISRLYENKKRLWNLGKKIHVVK